MPVCLYVVLLSCCMTGAVFKILVSLVTFEERMSISHHWVTIECYDSIIQMKTCFGFQDSNILNVSFLSII
jgi:hypothetical protein